MTNVINVINDNVIKLMVVVVVGDEDYDYNMVKMVIIPIV